MSTISKTIEIGEDSTGVITGLLSHFAKCEILQARLKVKGETKEGRNNLGINILYVNLNVLPNRLDSILTLAQLGKP